MLIDRRRDHKVKQLEAALSYAQPEVVTGDDLNHLYIKHPLHQLCGPKAREGGEQEEMWWITIGDERNGRVMACDHPHSPTETTALLQHGSHSSARQTLCG